MCQIVESPGRHQLSDKNLREKFRTLRKMHSKVRILNLTLYKKECNIKNNELIPEELSIDTLLSKTTCE